MYVICRNVRNTPIDDTPLYVPDLILKQPIDELVSDPYGTIGHVVIDYFHKFSVKLIKFPSAKSEYISKKYL